MAGKARPSAITKLSDGKSFRKWLVYGNSGVGKTVLAGSAPNALFLTAEAEGTESARAFGSEADEWYCESWSDLQDAYSWLHDDSGAKEYEWVIVDSLSEMEEHAWRALLEEGVAKSSARSIDKPALDDYQVIGNRLKRFINALNRLPVNVLYTAQPMVRTLEDREGDEHDYRSPLVGSVRSGVLSQKVCGMVTLVGLLAVHPADDEDEEDERRLWTAGSERYAAKDRHDTFGSFVSQPDIAEMEAAVDARKAKGNRTSGERTKKKKSKKPTAPSTDDS